MKEQKLEHWFQREFPKVMPNLLLRNEWGEYIVFGHYKIIKSNRKYNVTCGATEVGQFDSSKTALSWCIADKYRQYNLAREILNTDNRLASLSDDIIARTAAAGRCRDTNIKENIEIKIQSKIIQKKYLEKQLNKCVNLAKYYQQRGFRQ